MKITITLSEAEVKGLKDYLRDVGGIDRPKKSDITIEIMSFVSGAINAPQEAVSDYIRKYR